MRKSSSRRSRKGSSKQAASHREKAIALHAKAKREAERKRKKEELADGMDKMAIEEEDDNTFEPKNNLMGKGGGKGGKGGGEFSECSDHLVLIVVLIVDC